MSRYTCAMSCFLVGSLLTPQASHAQSPDASVRWGRPAAAASATRTVTLAPDTRSIHAKHGETVLFVHGSTRFAWIFDGLATSFDFRTVAPSGLVNQSLMVYVTMEMQGGK